MNMSVIESGQHQLAFRIDHARPLTGKRPNFPVRPTSNDNSPGNRNRLCSRFSSLQCTNIPVYQYKIDRPALSGGYIGQEK